MYLINSWQKKRRHEQSFVKRDSTSLTGIKKVLRGSKLYCDKYENLDEMNIFKNVIYQH